MATLLAILRDNTNRNGIGVVDDASQGHHDQVGNPDTRGQTTSIDPREKIQELIYFECNTEMNVSELKTLLTLKLNCI